MNVMTLKVGNNNYFSVKWFEFMFARTLKYF